MRFIYYFPKITKPTRDLVLQFCEEVWLIMNTRVMVLSCGVLWQRHCGSFHLRNYLNYISLDAKHMLGMWPNPTL
jgi:hypothetical protein